MINTLKHLAYTVQVRQDVIEAIISDVDKYYCRKVEVKHDKDGNPKLNKDGTPRQRILYPSTGVLKQIQRNIKNKVLSKIPLPGYAYGSVKGRDNIKNAKRHQGKKFIFTTDLKDFFPSINHHMVFNMFRSHNFSPSVSRVLTKLTTYKGMLPQGAPTSSTIANLVFAEAGSRIQSFASENNITFTSFVDDLTFSSPIDFKSKVASILEIIQSGNFKISRGKTSYRTKFPLVTGLIVKNNSISVPNGFMQSLEAAEKNASMKYRGKLNYLNRVSDSNK